jgi:hypothetical protein
MKNKISKPVLLFFVLASLLMSCSEKDIFENQDEFKNPKEEIGKLHNDALQYILENVTYKPQKGEVKHYVEDILKQKHSTLKSTVSLSSIPEFHESIDNLDLNIWLEEFKISKKLKSEMSKTFVIFRTANSLSEILNAIKIKEQNASNLFQGEDLEKYYEHLAVARYTSIFWYPEEDGGMNGIKYLNVGGVSQKSGLKSANAINWWKILAVDCVGGVMAGPVGYAGTSAVSVIMEL